MKLSQFRREFGGLELYTLLVEDLEDVAQSNCEWSKRTDHQSLCISTEALEWLFNIFKINFLKFDHFKQE